MKPGTVVRFGTESGGARRSGGITDRNEDSRAPAVRPLDSGAEEGAPTDLRADDLVAAEDPRDLVPADYRERLLGLRRNHNWNSEAARAISRAACQSALRLVERARVLRPDLGLPRVSTSVRGAVGLTWRGAHESLTAFVYSGRGDTEYQWEGPEYAYQHGLTSAEDFLDRLQAL